MHHIRAPNEKARPSSAPKILSRINTDLTQANSPLLPAFHVRPLVWDQIRERIHSPELDEAKLLIGADLIERNEALYSWYLSNHS